jgi:hypothetical protein
MRMSWIAIILFSTSAYGQTPRIVEAFMCPPGHDSLSSILLDTESAAGFTKLSTADNLVYVKPIPYDGSYTGQRYIEFEFKTYDLGTKTRVVMEISLIGIPVAAARRGPEKVRIFDEKALSGAQIVLDEIATKMPCQPTGNKKGNSP